jgi:hypothetical protein
MVSRHFAPEISFVDRYKRWLGLLAKHDRNSIIVDHGVWTHINDKLHCPSIPSGNISLDTTPK